MFQPAPRSRQHHTRRHLPAGGQGGGTMVSYAEVKSYLSKREIPQLFESLMAGLMYHRPENHIGYLQSCLEEVRASNGETKVQWSTFVNAKKRRISKEILPPLTPPKKQDSFSSSWSDNSRQSTPLPPISARTRTRTSLDGQDLRNTYILYHNPPPVLAKPKVPVVSVLGGLGSRIDELCERVVGRLRGLVHISTCSMLKTRMTIEGFYRVTSVPACAVVDSVLQAMSMVQSASALLVAGFPRNRGDIEEYRSRRVRMDGVVLVDFEEEVLRNFLEHEVASGVFRSSEIDAELERFKQDIISVAEYYDEKELLTVVMGDQDIEEMVDDLVLAIDKIIETRKDILDEETLEGRKDREADSPRNALMPSPDKLERPSTVEIRDATEEDIKSIEAETKKAQADEDDEEVAQILSNGKSEGLEEEPKVASNVPMAEPDGEHLASHNQTLSEKAPEVEEQEQNEIMDETQDVVEKMEFEKSENSTGIRISSVEEETGKDSKSDEQVQSEVIQQLSLTSELNTKENEFQNIDNQSEEQKSEEEEKEKSPNDHDDSREEDDKALEKDTDETPEIEVPNIPIIFAFENINVDYDEIRNLIANDLEMCFIDFQELMRNDGSNDDKFDDDESLLMLKGILRQDSVSYSNGFFILKFPFSLLSNSFIKQLLKLGHLSFVCKIRESKPNSEIESKGIEEEKLFHSSFSEKVRIIFVTENSVLQEIRDALQEIINSERAANQPQIETKERSENEDQNIDAVERNEREINVSQIKETGINDENNERISTNPINDNQEKDYQENEDVIIDDKTEDSTGKDIEDLVSDDTLNEGSKPTGVLVSDGNPDQPEIDDTHSQASTLPSAADETQRDRAILERQGGVEVENDNLDVQEDNKVTLIRQGTYSAGEEMKDDEQKNEAGDFPAEVTNEVDLEGKTELAENKEETVDENKEETGDENKEETGDENKEETEDENKSVSAEVKEELDSEHREEAPDDKNNAEGENKEETSEGKEDTEVDNKEVVFEGKNNTEEENDEAVSESKENTEAENKEALSEGKDNTEEEPKEIVPGGKDDTEPENKEAVPDDKDDTKVENCEEISENKKDTEVEKELVFEGKDDTEAEKEDAVSESIENVEVGNEEAVSNSKEDIEIDDEEAISESKEDKEVENKETNSEENEDAAQENVGSASEDTEPGEKKEVCERKDDIKSETEEVANENEDNNDDEKKDEGNSDINLEASSELKLEAVQNQSNQSNDEDLSGEQKDISERKEENPEMITVNDKNNFGDNDKVQDEANAEIVNSIPENINEDVNQAEIEKPLDQDDSKSINDDENIEKYAASDITENLSQSAKDESLKEDIMPNEENVVIEEKSELSKAEEHLIDENCSENLNDVDNNSNVSEEVSTKDVDASNDKSQINEENVNENGNDEIQSELQNEAEEREANEELVSISSTVSKEENSAVGNKSDVKDEPVSHKLVKKIRKIPDNDSDSNDENITIETRAEIHAVDCVSPIVDIEKSEKETIPDDIVESNDTENVNLNDDENQMNDRDISSDNHEVKEMKSETRDEEIILGNDESEGLSIKDVDSMRSETFSGKIQERNGSGILDESRGNDHSESEEPQERSSSSSRGEL